MVGADVVLTVHYSSWERLKDKITTYKHVGTFSLGMHQSDCPETDPCYIPQPNSRPNERALFFPPNLKPESLTAGRLGGGLIGVIIM